MLAGGGIALVALAATHLVQHELSTSALQSRKLVAYADTLRFMLEPGPSNAIRFPTHGPFDERLGYTSLPQHLQRLQAQGYAVVAQARQSPALLHFADRGFFPPYREKTRAGLSVLDCRGDALYESRYPQRAYAAFDVVPPLVRSTLAFIEDRDLLVGADSTRNPAVDPVRLSRAVLDNAIKLVNADHSASGGSTLATQIEKYRHSHEGRTAGVRDKYRQIASASVRAYQDGAHTRAARERILLDYVNTVPLGALRGWGEVHGLPDGLHAWYGADFEAASRALWQSPEGGDDLAGQALAYRQVLGLMIAQRRPAHYLGAGRGELARLTDSYLRVLAQAGLIGPALRDAALATRVALRDHYPTTAAGDYATRKAASFARVQLASLLDTPRLYDVDRLDLAVSTTIDARLQDAVSALLRDLRSPQHARAAGMMGDKLLERGDPAKLNYSFTLFESSGDGVNRVRVQADNLDQPFDINTGAKLELGSTAKLRTLVTYLELVAELHGRLEPMTAAERAQLPVVPQDRLTRWAVDYLASAADPSSLAAMLDAAMQRRFSASPGEAFFTGGGLHRFANYDRKDDRRLATLAEAFRESLNLPFIRLMREIVQHHVYRGPEPVGELFERTDHPQRAALLARFADREGRQFTSTFYHRHAGKPVDEMLVTLAGARPTPQKLAVIHRRLRPDASFNAFAAFVAQTLPVAPPEAALRKLYEAHAPGRYSLADQGYLSKVHPLELAVATWLRDHPAATLSEVVAATAVQRQEAYAWLMRTGAKGAQDLRIRSVLEIDAFEHIHQRWRRLGYPFHRLVPSFATAIGSSGDRPAALAELMGIILNDGLRLPTVQLDGLHFAAGTPYDTLLRKQAAGAQRVLAPEVAATLRRALTQVVDQGTARRLRGAIADAKGTPLAIGGKTGTGDNRIDTHGPGGALVASRVINRTATFVFFIGERHFGTLTAFVPGPHAEAYRFTSALPTQILKTMAPLLTPVVSGQTERPCQPLASRSVDGVVATTVLPVPTPTHPLRPAVHR